MATEFFETALVLSSIESEPYSRPPIFLIMGDKPSREVPPSAQPPPEAPRVVANGEGAGNCMGAAPPPDPSDFIEED